MVTIRLSRTGTKKRPFYRLVVADARRPRGGKFLENIGTFDPGSSPRAGAPGKDGVLNVNHDRLAYWTSKGALPSETVARLLKRAAKTAKA